MAKHSSRYRASPLASLQPRSKRETLFLIGVLLIATFFIVRVSQFRSLTPRGNTITAVLSTTQVVRGKQGPGGDQEPTAVFTEVFIDSGSGEGFRRPRKQSDAQVKYDNQRKSALPKPISDSSQSDALPLSGKNVSTRNQSDSSAGFVQRHSDKGSQQHGGGLVTADPAKILLPKNASNVAAGTDTKAVRDQAQPRSDAKPAKPAKQERAAQTGATDKSLPAQKSTSVQRQAEQAASSKVLPGLLDPKEVIVSEQARTQPLMQRTSTQMSPPPAPVIRQRITSVPADFDWQTYLLYNPELRDKGVTTQQSAEDHYIRIGYTEGMIYKRLRVLLRYTACTGLINQHYSHIAAFSLCAVLGAELVLPPAVKRDSFAHYFSVFKEHNEVKWTPAPLESLLNVDKIVEFWRGRGLTVHRVSFTAFVLLVAL